jgi:hypothetical protein
VLETSWVAYPLRRLRRVGSSSCFILVCARPSTLFCSPLFERAYVEITGGELCCWGRRICRTSGAAEFLRGALTQRFRTGLICAAPPALGMGNRRRMQDSGGRWNSTYSGVPVTPGSPRSGRNAPNSPAGGEEAALREKRLRVNEWRVVREKKTQEAGLKDQRYM